jgi:hypothetical protein
MDDVLNCPICGNKLKTSHHTDKLLHAVGKTANYAERICSAGYNHTLTLWADKDTKQVDLVKVSLNPTYSRFLEIDYVNGKCRIICASEGERDCIEIDRLLEPDFPDLVKLREQVALFIVLS